MDPAFRSRPEDEPHLTAQLLRQGWHGLKNALPEGGQKAMQGIEDWGESSGARPAAEGTLRALTPGEPWEVPLLGLGKAPKLAAAAAGALGMGEAEAGPGGLRKTLSRLVGAGAEEGVAKAARAARAAAPAGTPDVADIMAASRAKAIGGGGSQGFMLPSSPADAAPVAQQVIAKAKAPMVLPRTAKGLAPLTEAGEGDIAKSMIAEKNTKGATIPQAKVDEALTNRAELRAEPPTLPKPAGEMSPEEWQAFGAQHGVDMTRTPSQSLGISDLKTRKELMVPGGLQGKFTLPDVFELKANNFDPGVLPQDMHNELMKKFLRTYERPHGMDPTDQYNALNFALLLPNAPLTQNEFLAMRLRAKGPQDLERIGNMSPEQARANEMGTGAASRGGMGVKGTADYGNQPLLARLLRSSPDVFNRGEGETMADVARRVMNQIPGLGPKTSSLGVPWLDLARADTSAVDLHMIRNNMGRLMTDPELGASFTERLAGLTGQAGATPEQLLARSAADPTFGKQLEKAAINVVSSHPTAKYRIKGEVNPSVHPAVQPEKLAYEPKDATEFGPYYNRIVDYVSQSRGANPELPLFPEQWRLWDTYRHRVEPHEMAHPDIRKLPPMSWEEMAAALGEHKAKGYTSTYKDPITGEVHTQQLKEDYPTDWRKLAYFTAPPTAMAAALRKKDEQPD